MKNSTINSIGGFAFWLLAMLTAIVSGPDAYAAMFVTLGGIYMGVAEILRALGK